MPGLPVTVAALATDAPEPPPDIAPDVPVVTGPPPALPVAVPPDRDHDGDRHEAAPVTTPAPAAPPRPTARTKPDRPRADRPAPQNGARSDTGRVVSRPAPAGSAAAPVARAATAPGLSGADYAALVSAAVRRNLANPSLPGQTGVTRLALTIGAQGRVASVSIAGSSGYPVLDAAALSAARGISLPPPPGGRFSGTLPVRFATR
jgi:protein TonB